MENKLVIEMPSGYAQSRIGQLVFMARPFLRHSERENVIIYTPNYFIEVLKREISRDVVGLTPNKDITFNGFKIIPGYENKLVMAHKDFVLYQESELMVELPIQDDIKTTEVIPKA